MTRRGFITPFSQGFKLTALSSSDEFYYITESSEHISMATAV